MSWARRRKMQYIGGVALFVLIILFFIVRSFFREVPTCFDGKNNGDEAGVDCGGACALYCPNELANPKVRWVRSFEIVPGIVTAVAYIEHGNPGAAARTAPYVFRLYDSNNALIAERAGTTFIGMMGQSAIVETRIQVGAAAPALTRFEFTGPATWEKIPVDLSAATIKTDRSLLQTFTGGTRFAVTLDNQSGFSFPSIDSVAILYDADGNAITASESAIPNLGAQSTTVAYFTWPFVLENRVAETQIIPRFNPFTVRTR